MPCSPAWPTDRGGRRPTSEHRNDAARPSARAGRLRRLQRFPRCRRNARWPRSGSKASSRSPSFHPRLLLRRQRARDIDNATNRSPYPMLHLLREASVTRAVDEPSADAGAIFEANIATMRRLGDEAGRPLQQQCHDDAAERRPQSRAPMDRHLSSPPVASFLRRATRDLGSAALLEAFPPAIQRAWAIPRRQAQRHPRGRRAHRPADDGEPLVRSLLRRR